MSVEQVVNDEYDAVIAEPDVWWGGFGIDALIWTEKIPCAPTRRNGSSAHDPVATGDLPDEQLLWLGRS